MSNTDWAARLKEIVDCPLYGQRPFVCDGYPEECHVMIIGTNPATSLKLNWWECWIADSGFDYNLFRSKYKARRKKPGTTRHRLTQITDCLREHGLKCIETNVYRREARSEPALCRYDPADRYPNDEVLCLLMEGLQPPRAVIPHGKKATDWLARQEDSLLPDIQIPDRKLEHLSVGYCREDDIAYICDWVRSLCG